MKEYDYSAPGAYFITICAKDRYCLFGDIIDGKMALNKAGRVIYDCLIKTIDHYNDVSIDEFVIMPNHIHIIIVINVQNTQRRGLICKGLINQAPTKNNNWIMMKNKRQSLGMIVRYFKARSSKLIHDSGINYFRWQRNYYEHVIRNNGELHAIKKYIRDNPLNWLLDNENPANINP